MVGFWAYAANAFGNLRHVLALPSTTEAFESAQFGNLEERISQVSVVVQEQLDAPVALESRDGIDANVP
jgi:hypothetical protein